MAEYINRDELVRELECGIRAGSYEKGYEKYTHINDIDDCVDTVKYADKADVVEREKIDKAIKEMKLEWLKYDSLENRMLANHWLGKAIKILKRNIEGEKE